MNDIKIPHEYLPALLRMRAGSSIPPDMDKVDELIAAAEADQPPLPEGWVIRKTERPTRTSPWSQTPDVEAHDILWHLNGALYRFSDASGAIGRVDEVRDRLSPLRPTVTEAQFRAAVKAGVDMRVGDAKESIRNAFKAAGIEVQS